MLRLMIAKSKQLMAQGQTNAGRQFSTANPGFGGAGFPDVM